MSTSNIVLRCGDSVQTFPFSFFNVDMTVEMFINYISHKLNIATDVIISFPTLDLVIYPCSSLYSDPLFKYISLHKNNFSDDLEIIFFVLSTSTTLTLLDLQNVDDVDNNSDSIEDYIDISFNEEVQTSHEFSELPNLNQYSIDCDDTEEEKNRKHRTGTNEYNIKRAITN
ncbi:hypothetical protein QTN25_009289 [Entamoeba marina]